MTCRGDDCNCTRCDRADEAEARRRERNDHAEPCACGARPGWCDCARDPEPEPEDEEPADADAACDDDGYEADA